MQKNTQLYIFAINITLKKYVKISGKINDKCSPLNTVMERYANFERTIGHMLAVNEQGIHFSSKRFFSWNEELRIIFYLCEIKTFFFWILTEIATFMASDMPLSKLLNEEIPAGYIYVFR